MGEGTIGERDKVNWHQILKFIWLEDSVIHPFLSCSLILCNCYSQCFHRKSGVTAGSPNLEIIFFYHSLCQEGYSSISTHVTCTRVFQAPSHQLGDNFFQWQSPAFAVLSGLFCHCRLTLCIQSNRKSSSCMWSKSIDININRVRIFEITNEERREFVIQVDFGFIFPIFYI